MENSNKGVIIKDLENAPRERRNANDVSEPSYTDVYNINDTQILYEATHQETKQERLLADVLPSLCENNNKNLSSHMTSNDTNSKNVQFLYQRGYQKHRNAYTGSNGLSKMDERSQMSDRSHGGNVSQRSQRSHMGGRSQAGGGPHINERSQIAERALFSELSYRNGGSQMVDRSKIGDRSNMDEGSHSFGRSQTDGRSQISEGFTITDHSHIITERSHLSKRYHNISNRSHLSGSPRVHNSTQMDEISHIRGKSHIDELSQTRGPFQMGDQSDRNELYYMDKKNHVDSRYETGDRYQRIEPSGMDEQFEVDNRKELGEQSKMKKGHYIGSKSQMRERSQIEERPHMGRICQSERSQMCERPLMKVRSPLTERSPKSERYRKSEWFQTGEQPHMGRKKQMGEQPLIGERSPMGERPSFGEHSPIDERPRVGERHPVGERHSLGEGTLTGEWLSIRERSLTGERLQFGEQSPTSERPLVGERLPVGEQSLRDVRYRTDERSHIDYRPQSNDGYLLEERYHVLHPVDERYNMSDESQASQKSNISLTEYMPGRSRACKRHQVVLGNPKKYLFQERNNYRVGDTSKIEETMCLDDLQHNPKIHLSDGSLLDNMFEIVERSQINELVYVDKERMVGYGSKREEQSPTDDLFQFDERPQTDDAYQMCERIQMNSGSVAPDRCQDSDRSHMGNTSGLVCGFMMSEKSHIDDACRTDFSSQKGLKNKKIRTGDKSKKNGTINSYRSQAAKRSRLREKDKRFHTSNRSQMHDNTEIRWLCIPGDIPRIEQHAVVLASPTEVARVRNKLFCRPANGFGQNWFHLELKDTPSPTSDARYKIGKTQRSNGRSDTPNARTKIKRQVKSSNVPEKVSPKINTRLNPKVRGQNNRSRFTPGIKKIPNRCSLNYSRGIKQVGTQKRLKDIPAADCEFNNSNDTKLHLPGSSNQSGLIKHNQSITGVIIRVEGDGRCLFRSLVTCLSSDLQKARRDDFGCPLLRSDANYETLMADALRAQVVKLMMDNAHFYRQLERIVINADQPMPPGYSRFQDRLMDMTLTSTMPGDLELNATSTALERQVLVLDVNLRPIVVYGKERFPQSEVVTVRYTRLGPDVGHYDAVIPDLDSIGALEYGGCGDDESQVKQDNLTSLTPDTFDCLNNLVFSNKNRKEGWVDDTSRNSRHDRLQLSCTHHCRHHYDHHQQHHHHRYHCHRRRHRESEKENQQHRPCSSDQCDRMDWSPARSSTVIDDVSTQTSLLDDAVHSNNNDNKSCVTPKKQESKINSEKIDLRTDSYIQSQCNNVILDFLTDNVIFVANAESNDNHDESKDLNADVGLMNTNNSKKHPKRCQRTKRAVGVEKGHDSNRLHFGPSRWKTRHHRTKAVVKKRNKKRPDKSFSRKSYRKAKTKSSIHRRKYAAKTKWVSKNKQMHRLQHSKKERKPKTAPPAGTSKKLVTERVISTHYKTNYDICQKDNEIKKSNEEVFPNKPRSDLDETLKDGKPGPRCERSIEGMTPRIKGNATYGTPCIICELPVTDSLRLCTLCGRVAHKACVPASRKGGDGDYFVCSYCVTE